MYRDDMESGVQAFVPAVEPRGSVAKPYPRYTTRGRRQPWAPGWAQAGGVLLTVQQAARSDALLSV